MVFLWLCSIVKLELQVCNLYVVHLKVVLEPVRSFLVGKLGSFYVHLKLPTPLHSEKHQREVDDGAVGVDEDYKSARETEEAEAAWWRRRLRPRLGCLYI